MNIHFVVYRDKATKKINRYSSYRSNENLPDMIEKYNSENDRKHTAHLVLDPDLISALEMAEISKRVKDSDLKDIESAIENLSSEFYHLKEALND